MPHDRIDLNDAPSPEQKTHHIMIGLYVSFAALLLGQVVPHTGVQLACALGLLVLLGVIRHFRRNAPVHSPLNDHAVYLGRTIWVGSFIMMIGLAVAGYYVGQKYSLNQFMEIARNLAAQDLSHENTRDFGMIAITAAMPGILYFSFRILRGLWCGIQNIPLKNPKTLL